MFYITIKMTTRTNLMDVYKKKWQDNQIISVLKKITGAQKKAIAVQKF